MWAMSDVSVEAVECGMYICIKEFESRVETGVLIESSTEVNSVRDPDSFKITIGSGSCDGDCGTLDFVRVSPKVDAIYSNETYFNRDELSIRVPARAQTPNNIQHVNVSQAGIDTLSSYTFSLFDEGMFRNGLD